MMLHKVMMWYRLEALTTVGVSEYSRISIGQIVWVRASEARALMDAGFAKVIGRREFRSNDPIWFIFGLIGDRIPKYRTPVKPINQFKSPYR
jgi:hypothetical protein